MSGAAGGAGECFTGCRMRAKQSMDITYIPAALRGGARVLTSVRVEEVRTDGNRVLGGFGPRRRSVHGGGPATAFA